MIRSKFVKAFQERLFAQFPNGFQSWWPNFIFHFSDVSNITSILNSGKLYGRHKAVELGLMKNDNANNAVIDHTMEAYKNYVRCYFGAKTPTQYHNEGIKPQSQIHDEAHCPLPVFLLFDFVKLLSKEGVKFSSGNIAADGADVYSDLTNLNQLEFNHIYNRAVLDPEAYSRHIVYCRHAEVLVPDELDIFEYLKFICVRSEAEKETLLYGLGAAAKEQLTGKIKVFTKDGVFFNDRLFMNSVELSDNNIIMNFSNASKFEFDIQVEAEDYALGKQYSKNRKWKFNSKVTWKVADEVGSQGFYICIKIDGNTAYENILFNRKEGVF